MPAGICKYGATTIVLAWIRSKIALKPLIGISFFLTAALIVLIFMIKWAAVRFENFYISENEAYIKGEAAAFLSSLTREKAMKYDAMLRSIAVSSALIAGGAGFFLDHSDIYGKTPLNPNESLTAYSSNRIFSNDPLDLTMAMYWGAAEIRPDITKELNALSHADPLIIKAQKTFPDCVSAYIVTVSGMGRYFPNTHAVAELPPREEYIRKEPFYADAGPEKNADRKTVWANVVYPGKEWQGPMTAVNSPIYGKRGDFRGTAGLNITLNSFLGDMSDSRELKSFPMTESSVGKAENKVPRKDTAEAALTAHSSSEPSPSESDAAHLTDIGPSAKEKAVQLTMESGKFTGKLFSFLTDRESRLIAVLPNGLKLFGERADAGSLPGYSLSESPDPDVRAMARCIIEKDHQMMRLSPGGNACLIAFHAVPATGWRLGLAMPESGVLASLRETLEIMNPAVEKILIALTAAALSLLLFSTAMTLIFLITRFSRPSDSSHRDTSYRRSLEHDKMIADDDEMIDDEMIDDELAEDDLFNEYLEGQMMEEGLITENAIAEQSLNKPLRIEEQQAVFLTDSYNRMVEALKKVNELEKEHSVELQKEIAERRRVETEIRHLSSRLITSVEEGKKELARDLHDEFGQTLAALHMNAETLQSSIPGEFETQKAGISDLIGLIEQLGDKIRSISSNLRPDLLDDLGLVPTLEWYIKEFSEQRQDIIVDFQAIGFKKRRLSSERELVLYRVFQESINNVVKHAKAKTVDVTLTYSHPNVIFNIKDDGIGFDEETRGKDGIGLLGMRERIVSMKGQIDIRSAVSKGTTIRVELPVS